MLRSKYSNRTVFLMVLPLLFLPVVLTGQRAHEDAVPLKNWATPLYWQPNQAERDTGVGVTPKITFSTNQLSTSALTFVAITPCRVVDTRGAGGGFTGPAPFSGPSIAPSTSVSFQLQTAAEASITTPAPCGTIPSIAQAYSFNVTVVDKAGAGGFYLSVYPTGSPASVVTIVDYQATPGVTLANAAIVPAGTPNGAITVFDSGPTATVDVIIDMNGFYAAPTDLNQNTAVGAGALTSSAGASQNTALGYNALQNGAGGSGNTAVGYQALTNDGSGNGNTAVGWEALYFNTSFANTAVGLQALYANQGGSNNTAMGYDALSGNTSGNYNTAFGSLALGINSTANGSTAVGYNALAASNGILNTAVGYGALGHDNSGGVNTAVGQFALNGNTTGNDNTAIGNGALSVATNGGNNIAIGVDAAGVVSGGSNNIHIGSLGASGDSGIIRIGGTAAIDGYTQTSFFASGIYGVNLGGSAVSITSSGQLSSPSSSRRYKEDIQDMGETSRGLMDLRPVTFRYKKAAEDGSKPLQYGLIAEEVAEVYPDLVVYKNGQPDAVQYQMLPSMLLNEVQKQHQHAQQQDETIQQQQEVIRKLESRLSALEALLSGKVSAAATAGR